MNASRTLPGVALALSLCLAALAEDMPVPVRTGSTLTVPRVPQPPTLDGKLDDGAWAKAQPLRLWAYKSKAVRYQTEGWICRDDANLYFAARCFDDNLEGLVTEFDGAGMWKNDCIELFVVPDKRELFFSHLIVTCDGRTAASTWVPDEWGEPTRGKDVALACATGREEKAWTVELAVPIAAFGTPITSKGVWALGFNREKHNDPAEVSSFQGGFNRPREYPDLVFDGRTVVVDGLGCRNLGSEPQDVTVVATIGDARKETKATVGPGKTLSLTRQALPGAPREGDEMTLDLYVGGKPLVRETYTFVAPARAVVPLDVTQIPPPKFRETALDDPVFFPIGVWLQPAGQAAAYAKMGVNVYVGGIDSYPRPKDKAFLDAVQAHGMHVICPFKTQYIEERLHEHPAFLAWMFGDEPDNADRATGKVKRTPEAMLVDFARVRAADPTHRVYLNLGCGVANERFVGRGASDEQYAAYPKACDIVSYDVYPCNSIQPNGPDRLHLVAKGVDRLRRWARPGQPVWCWIEANKIHKGPGRAPTPDEVKTQIWMALVHGATGYGFFCHSWAGPRMKVSGIEPDMQAALAPINAEVRQLAPVLNSPDAGSATVANPPGTRVDVLVRRHGGATYVFAVNMMRKPAKPAITIEGIGSAAAQVLFEGRTVDVRDGRLVDVFKPYAVHRYRIPAK